MTKRFDLSLTSMVAKVPKIIYGTAWKEGATTGLVVSAVLQGFRAIDTACQPKHYREDLVGNALQELEEKHGIKREDLWLQTKFTSISGQDRNKPLPYNPASPVREQLLESFQTSLRNLRTSYLDSYILHSPLSTLEETLEAWKVLGALQDEGRVHLIGVSNAYKVSILQAMAQERPVQVVQNRWYEKNGWDKDVFRYCKENGVMYQSFWTLTGSPRLLQHPTLLAVADKLKCTVAQAYFRFAQVNGVTPLAGSKNEGRMHDGVETEYIQLDDDALQDELQELKRLVFE